MCGVWCQTLTIFLKCGIRRTWRKILFLVWNVSMFWLKLLPNKRPVMPEFLDKSRVRNATSNHKLSNAVVLGSRWNGATPSRQFSEMRSVKMQIGISVALEKKQCHFHDWIRNIFTVAFEIRAKKSRIGFQMKLTSFYFDINNFESFKLNMSESEI